MWVRCMQKMPTIVPEARAALAGGYAVVLGIQSTGEVTEPHAKTPPAVCASTVNDL